MSLITRCPACGTMFKVVPDQLRISDGWVRCGHCGEVFDASAHMQDTATLAAAGRLEGEHEAPDVAEAAAGAASPAPAPRPQLLQPSAYSPSSALPESGMAQAGAKVPAADEPKNPPPWAGPDEPGPEPEAGHGAGPEAGPGDGPAVAPPSGPARAFSRWRLAVTRETAPAAAGAARTGATVMSPDVPASPPDTPSSLDSQIDSRIDTRIDEPLPEEAPDSEQLEAQARELRPSPLDAPFLIAPSPVDEEPASTAADAPDEEEGGEPAIWARSEQEPDLQDLEFVRKAQRRALWQRRSVRAVLALALVLLGLLLAAQVAVQDRDRLAATRPGLRPLVGALCVLARCQIGPPRQIDAVAIDASQFTRLRGDSYRLSLTLRNQAATPVATPAIELTLTDSQDQPVVRRVLQPAELAPGMDVLAPNTEWSGSVGVAVSTAGLPARIAGYRVLAFYP